MRELRLDEGLAHQRDQRQVAQPEGLHLVIAIRVLRLRVPQVEGGGGVDPVPVDPRFSPR